MNSTVNYRSEGHVALISIARPERCNAISVAVYDQLGDALGRAEDDPRIHAAVLYGEGEHFTAGNDLADFQALGEATSVPGINFLRRLRAFGKPLVAAVEGYAIGVGTTLLLHCDLAYAADNARFRLPFTSLGLTPEGASTLLLRCCAGDRLAAELLLLGEPFDASTALRARLVNQLVAPGMALNRALHQAHALAALPAAAVSETRRLMRAETDVLVSQVMNEEERVFLQRVRSPEAQAAFATFLQR